MYYYQDSAGTVQGPFGTQAMQQWFASGHFTRDQQVSAAGSQQWAPIGHLFKPGNEFGSWSEVEPAIGAWTEVEKTSSTQASASRHVQAGDDLADALEGLSLGKKKKAAAVASEGDLPPNWQAVPSKSRPGETSYLHVPTGLKQGNRPTKEPTDKEIVAFLVKCRARGGTGAKADASQRNASQTTQPKSAAGKHDLTKDENSSLRWGDWNQRQAVSFSLGKGKPTKRPEHSAPADATKPALQQPPPPSSSPPPPPPPPPAPPGRVGEPAAAAGPCPAAAAVVPVGRGLGASTASAGGTAATIPSPPIEYVIVDTNVLMDGYCDDSRRQLGFAEHLFQCGGGGGGGGGGEMAVRQQLQLPPPIVVLPHAVRAELDCIKSRCGDERRGAQARWALRGLNQY
jgi:hypothetical protein